MRIANVNAQYDGLRARHLTRGTIYANLAAQRSGLTSGVRINEALLGEVLRLVEKIPLNANLRPASLDGILAIKGIIETVEPFDPSIESEQPAVLSLLETALSSLKEMRAAEGDALSRILERRIEAMSALVIAADKVPGRKPEVIRRQIEANVAALIGQTGLDPARLHQEAVLLAAKADIREELDRLHAHFDAARVLLRAGGAIGRRLDFLAQEISREVNTLCAKSNDASLTAIGLDLKTEVEQFREQVQNIE